ncbi:MAG: hypothetical protein JSV04_04900, partial [Candidatus Heimdallarchaeota archaeon]
HPVITGKINYCQGNRLSSRTSSGSLTPMAQVANRFFARLLSIILHQKINDLGPLRVMTWDTLSKLNMRSAGYGWTIEMSAKILKAQVKLSEVPVQYKRRFKGISKISGNFVTALRAAFVMSLTLLRVMIFWRPQFEN